MVFCSKCGTEAAEDAAFCSACGAPLNQTQAPAPEVVVIGDVSFHPGTGAYQGYYSARGGGPWVKIVDGRVIRVKGERSAGRTVGGVVLIVIAALAGLQAWSWFDGYNDLEQRGNQFAGALVPLFLGASAVAIGFLVWGIMLLERKQPRPYRWGDVESSGGNGSAHRGSMKSYLGGLTAVMLLIAGCGESSGETSAKPVAAQPTSSAPDTPSASPAPSLDEMFAAASGLSGAQLQQGVEWSASMCAQIAQTTLSKGDGDLKWINTAMLTWLDEEDIDWLMNRDVQATMAPLTIAGASVYCPEFADGVATFWGL